MIIDWLIYDPTLTIPLKLPLLSDSLRVHQGSLFELSEFWAHPSFLPWPFPPSYGPFPADTYHVELFLEKVFTLLLSKPTDRGRNKGATGISSTKKNKNQKKNVKK